MATAAGALSVTCIFVLWLALHLGGDTGVRDFDDVVTALAALFACLNCLFAFRRADGAERRFWFILGLALGAWTGAEVIWGIYDLVLKVAIPVPSWADAGYLGAIPLAAVALLSHPSMQTGGTRRARAALDALAIGASLLLLSWTFVLGPIWRDNHLSNSGSVVALAYPFGDVVIIFLVVMSIRSVSSLGRRPLLWVLLGLSAMAISDSTYAYLVDAGRYATGNLVDAGWVIGYLAVAVGAASHSGVSVRTTLSPKSEQEELTSFVIPYVPVVVALSAIAVELELHRHIDRVTWLTGFGLALLVVARQVLALVDRRQELFPSEPKRPESTSPHNGLPRAEHLIEAGSWPQFLRRSQ